MVDKGDAFGQPIGEGRARILVRLQHIKCEVENNAPDFISVDKDSVYLKVDFPDDAKVSSATLTSSFKLNLAKFKPGENEAIYNLEQEYIWFDINIEEVKDVWVADLYFSLESQNPRYLAYYIKELDHQFEWLQPDIKTGEIKTMSITKKKYKVPKFSGKESFSATEVLRCADMINRSIRKIDLRTGGAYVKFNTDKGKLEPLIIGIAEKLGYEVEPLERNVILDMESSGEKVSHSIYIKGKV
ncbi:MAG: hypothetical protein ED557_14780 [Balneola sp.]|nr:MAG: hypothetical protein ED557_14780 [Balneola sp.]